MQKKILLILIITLELLYAQHATENNASNEPALILFDSNHDQRISYMEASEILQEHFCQYDIDQSGYLTGQEIKDISPKYIKK